MTMPHFALNQLLRQSFVASRHDGGARIAPSDAPQEPTPRMWWQALKCNRGIAALEFAIVAPVLLLVLLGIVYVSILFNNYLEVNNAAGVAGRVLAESVGVSTTPYTSTKTAVYNQGCSTLAT